MVNPRFDRDVTEVTPLADDLADTNCPMNPSPPRIDVPLIVRDAPRVQTPAAPRAPWMFAGWMAAGATVAVVAGLVLGILASLEAGVGGERWTQVVEAHGRLQLFGFAAVFITALAFEFLIRLYQRRPFPLWIRAGIPAAIGLGALVQSAGQVYDASVGVLAIPGALLVLAGSVAFAVVTWRTAVPRRVQADPQPLFFRAAGVWLVAAAALSLWTATQAEAGAVLPVDSHAVVELFLRGFVMNVIIAVALRAFAGHLDLTPPSARRQIVVFGLMNAATAAWLAGQGLGALPEIGLASRAGDVGFAIALLLFTVWFGILRPLRDGFREPRYRWLVPLAWSGAVAYALLLAGVALWPGGYDLSLYQQGAIRHVFMLGFMAPLMLAMAHVVLARFGTGRVPAENALTAACLLLLVSAPLRVLPALFVNAPGSLGQSLLGFAGFATMAALALAAFVCLRTVAGIRRMAAR